MSEGVESLSQECSQGGRGDELKRKKLRKLEQIKKDAKKELEDELNTLKKELQEAKDFNDHARKMYDQVLHNQDVPINEDVLKNAKLGKLSQRDFDTSYMDQSETVKYFRPGQLESVSDIMSRHNLCALYKSRCRCSSRVEKYLYPIKKACTEHTQKDGNDEASPKIRKRRHINKDEYEIGEKELGAHPNLQSRLNKLIYHCDQGLFVHASYFGDNYRKKQSTQCVVNELKKFAICTKCTTTYGNNELYIDIMRRTRSCVICKRSSDVCSKNNTAKQVPVCTICAALGYEPKLFQGLKVLQQVFPHNNFKIHQHLLIKDTHCKKSSSNRYADFVVTMEDGPFYGIVIIECDENCHAEGYNKQDEIAKFKQQSIQIIVDGMKHWIMQKKNPKNVKVMFLRYNPDKEYQAGNSKGEITPEARVMAVRQHVIAFKQNLQKVRNFIVLYLFYNLKTSQHYPFNVGYSGCGSCFQCPGSESLESDWEFCTDATETVIESQKGKRRNGEPNLLQILQENRVKWSQIFDKNKLYSTQVDINDMFPEGIITEVTKNIKTLAD